MSQYTITIREICNGFYGDGWDTADIDDVVNAGRSGIFDFDYNLFDNDYKSVIETKVIRHYYMYEIGQETFNLWHFDFKTKWLEIISYYDKFYKADQLKFDPLKNTDYTTDTTSSSDGVKTDTGGSHTDSVDDNKYGSITVNQSNQTDDFDGDVHTTSHTSDNGRDDHIKGSDQTTTYLDRESTTTYNSQDTQSGSVNTVRYTGEQDTPQGKLVDLKDVNYLSSAGYVDETVTPNNQKSAKTGTDKVRDSGSVTVSNSGIDSDERINTIDLTQDVVTNNLNVTNSTSNTDVDGYSLTKGTVDVSNNNRTDTSDNTESTAQTHGKTGSETYSEMLQKYRDTFINIDMMIINELRDMFMYLW